MSSIHLDPADFRPVIESAIDAAIRKLEASRPRDGAGRILLSKREASAVLGVSEATLDRLRKSDLPAVKLDGKVLFRPAALEDCRPMKVWALADRAKAEAWLEGNPEPIEREAYQPVDDSGQLRLFDDCRPSAAAEGF